MAITSIKTGSSFTNLQKYNDAVAGNPPLMAAPTATDGGTGSTVSVAFTAVTGATSYSVLSNPGSFAATGAASPLTVSGLTSGTAYTFQVRGINSTSVGPYSAASNSVTPVTPTSFESIATYTVSGSSTASFTFSSIPSTYKALQLRGIVRTGGNDTVWMRLNADTGTNYSGHTIKGKSDSTVDTDANANANKINPIAWAIGTTSIWGSSIIDIQDYASTSKYKTVRAFFGADNNASTGAGIVYVASGNWRSTSAVTDVTIATDTTAFTAGTTFALYGIKG